jgi:hypothetical protein
MRGIQYPPLARGRAFPALFILFTVRASTGNSHSAHSRASGNPEAGDSEFVALDPRLRGGERKQTSTAPAHSRRMHGAAISHSVRPRESGDQVRRFRSRRMSLWIPAGVCLRAGGGGNERSGVPRPENGTDAPPASRKHIPALHRAIAGGGALFVDGEERCFGDAVPQRGAISRQRLDPVGVHRQRQPAAE